MFGHKTHFALTKEAQTYIEPGRDLFLDHFFKATEQEKEFDPTYLDIPVGEMIELPGYAFNPQWVAENEDALREMKNRSPYLFDVLADACDILIADAERYIRPEHQWKSRFPDITRKLGQGDLSKFHEIRIRESYQHIFEVTPGAFVCEYFKQWATAVIKRKND